MGLMQRCRGFSPRGDRTREDSNLKFEIQNLRHGQRTRTQLPAPDTADIDVNEAGVGVKPNAAPMECQGSIAQLRGLDPRYADIDGLGLHVETLPGDSRGFPAKDRVAPGSPVAADYLYYRVRPPDKGRQICKQVKEPGIEVAGIAGPVIPEVVLQLRDCFRQIGFSPLVDDVDRLTGVGMAEAQPVFTWHDRCRRIRQLRWGRKHHRAEKQDQPGLAPQPAGVPVR